MTYAFEEVRSAMKDAILEAVGGRRFVEAALAYAQSRADEATARV
jgi:hypothetical protein